MKPALQELIGTRWRGQGELWLDHGQNEAILSECTMSVEDGAVRYTWSYEGKPHEGSYTLRDGGADFTDTWHAPSAIPCDDVPGLAGLFAVTGTYAAGDGPRWGWRSILSRRPSGELVLQMTNITPWGEDGRAVRMVCTREA